MEELLYLSDVIRKYRGKLNDEVLNSVIKKYDNRYNALIKRNPLKKDELEAKFLSDVDEALEKLLLN